MRDAQRYCLFVFVWPRTTRCRLSRQQCCRRPRVVRRPVIEILSKLFLTDQLTEKNAFHCSLNFCFIVRSCKDSQRHGSEPKNRTFQHQRSTVAQRNNNCRATFKRCFFSKRIDGRGLFFTAARPRAQQEYYSAASLTSQAQKLLSEGNLVASANNSDRVVTIRNNR